jgi:hypothetical protein
MQHRKHTQKYTWGWRERDSHVAMDKDELDSYFIEGRQVKEGCMLPAAAWDVAAADSAVCAGSERKGKWVWIVFQKRAANKYYEERERGIRRNVLHQNP